MARLTGTLTLRPDARSASAASGGGARENDADWTGYRVSLFYTAKILGDDQLIEKQAVALADGRFALETSGNESDDDAARLVVFAPGGETAASVTLRSVRRDRSSLDPIPVGRAKRALDLNPIARARMVAARISGRVMAPEAGSANTGGLALRVFGKLAGAADFTPIWSGTTDRSGYFAGDVLRLALDEAVAEIALSSGAERHAATLGADGWLLEPLILLVAGGKAAEDCACDIVPPAVPGQAELATQGQSYSVDLGTSCQSFTIPNRTLEEFDYYQIVRTSDPAIKGLTLPDTVRSELDLDHVNKVLLDRGTLAAETNTSVYAMAQLDRTSVVADAPINREGMRMMTALASARPTPLGATATANAEKLDIADYIDIAPLQAERVDTAARWRVATDDATARQAVELAVSKIPPAAMYAALEDPDGFTPVRLMTLERRASANALAAYLNWRLKPVSGRGVLDESNEIDWDYTPEFYQATSVAHGHLLHFKQEWKADGYSLGELLSSIPLAPGQKKQISVLDWDRDDRASRSESTVATEALQADLSRDRDINEIANANFRESLKGGSSADVEAVGGGIGFAIGPLVIGGGGGSSWASSTAWSDNSRNFSANSLNQLADQTSQAVSAVRNQRSTVVRSSTQHEHVGATTEVIANHNRCHALTIQHFEVLRHFAVHERLAGVQECLFVPLEMTLFDDAKVLRWYDILHRSFRRRSVEPGFPSIRRLNSPDQIPPDRRFADDPIEEMSGSLSFRVSIARPKDPTAETEAALEQTEWGFLGFMLKVQPETIYEQYRRNSAKRDKIFQDEIAPEAARIFLESLQVVLIDRDGGEHDAGFDVTVASRYLRGGIMEVALDDTGAGPRLTRANIAGVEIRTDYPLPEYSKVLLETVRIDYRTERMRHELFGGRPLDDVQVGDSAFLSTGALSWEEERNQLREDRRRRRRLLRHLNDNIEYYHRAIWLGMDSNRRFMLLDGFEAPNSGGRSIASVVENRLLGVVGNCLVMPVAPGFQLDPVLAEAIRQAGSDELPGTLLEKLYEVEPSPPRRHSVPTRGVFAEAMTGTCKSCELIEEDRFWRWKDFPLPDSPPPIAALSTDSRFAELGDLAPTAMPAALINFQQIPNAPNPTGMAAALDILGKDVFKDLTGLTENQKNAMAAFTTAMASSESFASEAFDLVQSEDAARNLDRKLGQIDAAKTAGYLTPPQASSAARDALVKAFGGDVSRVKGDVTQSDAVKEAMRKAADSPDGSATIKRDKGEESESVSFTSQPSDLTIGKAAVQIIDIPFDIWLDVPLIKDQITAASDYEDSARTSDIELARFLGIFNAGGHLVDIVQSALDAGYLRANPADATKFQIKVPGRLAYPADPADSTKLLAPSSGKYPFVAVIHGNSRAWEMNLGAPVDTGRTAGLSNSPLFAVPVSDRNDFTGYEYLQKALGELDTPIVSISFSQAFANMTGSMVELRSEMLIEAMRQVVDQLGKPGKLLENVDFGQTGLMGHSRGGEAVVRAFLAHGAKAAGFSVRATCSLAPTDMRGSTNAHKMAIPGGPNGNYLVMLGTEDGDVAGDRAAGIVDLTGTGFRLFDRSTAQQSMVVVPNAIHNAFNHVWFVNGKDNTGAQMLDEAQHQELAIEFIGGFFDRVLNDSRLTNAQKSDLERKLRNEVKIQTTVSGVKTNTPVAIQWRFGASEKPIDSFQNAAAADTGTRHLGSGGSVIDFVPLTPPAGSPETSRDMRVPHMTKAYLLDTATISGATSTLSYDLPDIDMTAFDNLTFRLGMLYPITSQAAINPVKPPEFDVIFEDAGGVKSTFVSGFGAGGFYDDLANGWERPNKKVLADARGESTLMYLQTLRLFLPRLALFALPGTIDGTKIRKLSFAFKKVGAPPEIWLDTIVLIKNRF